MYTKLKDISKKVATQLNLPEEEVYKANLTYWLKVKEKMVTDVTDIYIGIINIGTLKAKKSHVKKIEENLKRKETLTNLDEIKLNKVLTLIEIFNKLENEVKCYQTSNN